MILLSDVFGMVSMAIGLLVIFPHECGKPNIPPRLIEIIRSLASRSSGLRHSIPFHSPVQVRTVSQAAAVRRSVTLSSVRVTWPCASATPTSVLPAELLITGTAKMSHARTAAFREEPRRCKDVK